MTVNGTQTPTTSLSTLKYSQVQVAFQELQYLLLQSNCKVIESEVTVEVVPKYIAILGCFCLFDCIVSLVIDVSQSVITRQTWTTSTWSWKCLKCQRERASV